MATRTALKRSLQEIRQEQRLTRSKLAARLGVSTVTVFAWERQGNRPRADVYADLLEVLQVTPDELDLEPWVITSEHRRRMSEGMTRHMERKQRERAAQAA